MNESLLKSLIRLFVLIYRTDGKQLTDSARIVISNFLEKEFNREQIKEYLIEIDSQISHRVEKVSENETNQTNEIELVCNAINHEFEQHQKVWLILQLIEFINDIGELNSTMLNVVRIVAEEFNITDEEFENGKQFISARNPYEIPKNFSITLVENSVEPTIENVNHIYHAKLPDRLFALRIASTNTILVKFFGDGAFFLNSRPLQPERTYILAIGSVIRNPKCEPIYYSKIVGTYYQIWGKSNIRLTAENISYRHKGSKNGIYPFTFDSYSGQLVAVIGGSGVGKSTLINLLNGNLKPATGKILINGYDLHAEKKNLEGIIGYVPQDDLLIEDLTVYQNLYYSARFCFGDKSTVEIKTMVEETIKDFDLFEARNLKVGNPVNKFISGGQRKRLNIAMELIREPAILFTDEPTSGLSSFDSDRIMLILKRQTFKGKIVIVNIHQPSSDIYKLFDKVIILDHGGRVVFQGNPMDAIVYFKKEGNYLKAYESECLCCGNVNTELILKVVEARVVNEYGKLTRKRKRSAQEWYEAYLQNTQSKINPTTHEKKLALPPNSFKIPKRKQQTAIYFKRNILSKLANRQFMAISLLEAPVLAFILAFFSKFSSGTLNNPNQYIFSNNDNIPSFLFMSVVACIFMGLTLSAEEIFKDQRVRLRERFLNLSYLSYINSKLLVLSIFSLVQTLLFVLVGNYILGINGAFFSTWIILFSTAFCANLIGLNISAALNSVVAIYITIPLIMVPMLLLSGVIVRYDKLQKSIMHPEFVPVIGDLVPIRWSYEALCVELFKNNKFNKHFFDLEQKISNNTYYSNILIPKLIVKLDESNKSIISGKVTKKTKDDLNLVQHEIPKIKNGINFTISTPDVSLLSIEPFSVREISRVKHELELVRTILQDSNKLIVQRKDKTYLNLLHLYGSSEKVYALKRDNHNKALEELVLNRNETELIASYKNKLVRKYNAGYALPTSTIGRAHLFSPVKILGTVKIETLWFNTMVIWSISLFFYFALLVNFFRALNKYIERFHFWRLAKRISKYIPH
ncbi:MAG TPA: ATP-binding cassette domain-containing protein [Tenuifilaceae bacterium]|nr:ATP-binding cassette domain-containing protein [Tenuifilaceae bacterium]